MTDSAKETQRPNQNEYSLRLEKEFREVIATLENSTFFIQLWPQIEEVRYQLEKYFDNNGSDPDVEYESKSFTDDTGTRGQSVQLKREVFRLVNSIGFSVPGTQRLLGVFNNNAAHFVFYCLLYTSPSPRDATLSRMPSSA